eukprot:SAG31_NODE_3209_length_4550_cov_4.465513_3_plen_150_part_00
MLRSHRVTREMNCCVCLRHLFSFSSVRDKAVFGFRIVLEDLEAVDPDLYSCRIQYLRESKYAESMAGSMISTLEDLELFFVDDSNNEDYSASPEVELKLGGADEKVTEDTKAEYLQLFVEHRLIGGELCIRLLPIFTILQNQAEHHSVH